VRETLVGHSGASPPKAELPPQKHRNTEFLRGTTADVPNVAPLFQ
jgi:hypothetical protein